MNNFTNKYPKYVKLRTPNPYPDGNVVCNGISVSDKKVTLIINPTMFRKLSQIEKYLEEVENV